MPSTESNEHVSPTGVAYGAGWGNSTERQLLCPSGAVALVKAPGIDKLIEARVVEHFDFLQGIVQDKHIDRVKGKKPQDHKKKADVASDEQETAVALKLMKEPATLARLTGIMDRVAEVMVVNPPLTRPVKRDEEGEPILNENGTEIPLKWADRDATCMYTDTVDFADKAHILTYTVGKVANLKQFRGESE